MGPESISITVREATATDVALVARIWHEGWRDGHLGHVPEGLVAHRGAEQFVTRTRDRIRHTWVAEVNGEVVGFVAVKDDELEQIFVARTARGSGVAVALLRRGEAEIRDAGNGLAWLAVVTGNTRARTFYERHSWRDAGAFVYEAETADGPFAVPSQRYERGLT